MIKFESLSEQEKIAVLERVEIYCQRILDHDPKFSTDWGKGYRECEIDFAKIILKYLENT
jgi:hypothetical protein